MRKPVITQPARWHDKMAGKIERSLVERDAQACSCSLNRQSQTRRAYLRP